jgi:transposase-like protein
MKADPLERIYNHDYGLTNDTRRKIIDDADAEGVRAAAERHNVSTAIIYSWRRSIKAYTNGDKNV